jgi:hypothetical protein
VIEPYTFDAPPSSAREPWLFDLLETLQENSKIKRVVISIATPRSVDCYRRSEAMEFRNAVKKIKDVVVLFERAGSEKQADIQAIMKFLLRDLFEPSGEYRLRFGVSWYGGWFRILIFLTMVRWLMRAKYWGYNTER